MSLVSGGLIKYGLVNQGLVKAINVVNSRYFRRNEGTTDHISIPEVTINTGDILAFKFESPSAQLAESQYITDSLGEGAVRVAILLSSNGSFQVGPFGPWSSSILMDGVSISSGSPYPTDGKLHTVEIMSAIDGLKLGFLGARRDGLLGFTGVMSDVVITSEGTPIRSYAGDDNSDTIKDSVGGFDGTVINGNADDWGLFTEIVDGWKGQGLTVPPWDSVDQELLNA